MKLPLRLRDMSPAWFAEILRTAGVLREAEVVSVEFEPIGAFTTQLWRVRLHYDAATDAPPSLVLKRSAKDRPDRIGEGFETEIRFYREIAESTPVRLPRCYHGAVDSATGRGLLLLEDLSLEPTDWLAGPSDAHAHAALAAMARLHASRWQRVAELDWIPHFGDESLAQRFEAGYALAWRDCRELYGDTIPGVRALGDALVGRVAQTLAPLSMPATLLHGDAHAENMPLSTSQIAAAGGPEVVFLDWAGPRRGNPGVDVGFFVVMSYPVDRRRAVEKDLVAQHADWLRVAGGPRSGDPWRDYRLGVLRRFTRIVELAGTLPLWNPEQRDSPLLMPLPLVVTRCAQAAVDLETLELVE